MGRDDNKFSRRQMVSGFSVGLAATVVPPTFTENMPRPPIPHPLQDPTDKYPKPPFKAQSQPWPGLAGKMEPRPDHDTATTGQSCRSCDQYKSANRVAIARVGRTLRSDLIHILTNLVYQVARN